MTDALDKLEASQRRLANATEEKEKAFKRCDALQEYIDELQKSNDSMYKTLQEAAAQESAYKTMVADLKRRLAMMEEGNKKTPSNQTLGEAHAALDNLLSLEWAKSPRKLPSIAEADEAENSSVIQLGHAGATSQPGPTGSPAARVLELQRQVRWTLDATDKMSL